jgi:hypothetical protein
MIRMYGPDPPVQEYVTKVFFSQLENLTLSFYSDKALVALNETPPKSYSFSY